MRLPDRSLNKAFLDEDKNIKQFDFEHPIYQSLPSSLFEFLKMILDVNPKSRPNAEKALNILKKIELDELFILSESKSTDSPNLLRESSEVEDSDSIQEESKSEQS